MSLDELLVRLNARNIKYLKAYDYDHKAGTTHKGALKVLFSCYKIKIPVEGREQEKLLVPVELIRQIYQKKWRYKEFTVKFGEEKELTNSRIVIDGFYETKEEGLSENRVLSIFLTQNSFITDKVFADYKKKIRDRVVIYQKLAQDLLKDYDTVCTVQWMGGKIT